jgi:cell cycle sensor histidine kinase DivJ
VAAFFQAERQEVGAKGAERARLDSRETAVAVIGVVIPVSLIVAGLPSAALLAAVFLSLLPALAILLGSTRWRERPSASPPGRSREYQALSEAIDELVLHLDASGHVLSANENARRLFDLDPATLRGTALFNRVHVADRPAFLQAIVSARRGDKTEAATVRLRSGEVGRSAGGIDEPVFAWMEIRFRAAPESLGGTALVAVARNVTGAKELERRLETAQAESVLAVALKDRMLANVSHELRTPLNAILGFSEILGDTALAPTDAAKRTEYARIIHSSAEHLLSVVNLVLDMSRIEAGKFEIAPEPFEVEPLIRDCGDMLRLKAENGSVALNLLPMPERLEIVADKRAFRQIVLNLMSNAVKFTPAGGEVTIGVRIENSAIQCFVADTGIGIAAADLPRLGNPFFQVRSTYDRRFEGAGLGLSLVRGLVGLHGGSMLMESAEGIGTRVTVSLPADCRDTARAGAGASRLDTAALSRSEPNSAFDVKGTTERGRADEERRIA